MIVLLSVPPILISISSSVSAVKDVLPLASKINSAPFTSKRFWTIAVPKNCIYTLSVEAGAAVNVIWVPAVTKSYAVLGSWITPPTETIIDVSLATVWSKENVTVLPSPVKVCFAWYPLTGAFPIYAMF